MDKEEVAINPRTWLIRRFPWIAQLPEEIQDLLIEQNKSFTWTHNIICAIEMHPEKREEILWTAVLEMAKQIAKYQERLVEHFKYYPLPNLVLGSPQGQGQKPDDKQLK